MTVLEKVNKKASFANGAFFARPQFTTYDLQAVTRLLLAASGNLQTAGERSKRSYNFPAPASNSLLFLDEGLRLPISLTAMLQTAASYRGMNWEQPLTRRYICMEFFRKYCELVLRESLRLALTRQIGLDLSASNLVVTVLRGEPTGVQLRQIGGVGGPKLSQTAGTNFEIALTDEIFHQKFAAYLLNENLRPLVLKLIEISRAKPEVFWDFAIETLLDGLDKTADEIIEPEPARRWLLVEELDPGDRMRRPAPAVTNNSSFLPLQNNRVIYLKRRCCEKFKKDQRCSNCPGSLRLPA